MTLPTLHVQDEVSPNLRFRTRKSLNDSIYDDSGLGSPASNVTRRYLFLDDVAGFSFQICGSDFFCGIQHFYKTQCSGDLNFEVQPFEIWKNKKSGGFWTF